jgi:hypothetical protein
MDEWEHAEAFRSNLSPAELFAVAARSEKVTPERARAFTVTSARHVASDSWRDPSLVSNLVERAVELGCFVMAPGR